MSGFPGMTLPTRKALTLLRAQAPSLDSRADLGDDGDEGLDPTGPASAGSVVHDIWIDTIATNHQIEREAVQNVVTRMPLATEDDLDLAERVLSCRPTEAEAIEWAANPPTEQVAALIAALR